MRLLITAMLLSAALLGATATPVWGGVPAGTPCTLASGSQCARGCFGDCTCPHIEAWLHGTFILREQPPSPSDRRFAVDEVRWVVGEPGHPISITGSGTYSVGGELAARQRMVLNLSLDGGPVRRYDSGEVAGGRDFPRISLALRLHATPACTDTVLTIDTAPDLVGLDPRQGPGW